MPSVGFVTARFLGGLYADDALAARALNDRGYDVVPVVWNEPFEVGAFDALVVRSPWDWYQHRRAFREFLGTLSDLAIPVFNAPALLTRFADKTYFRHLDALGLDTVPTAFFTPGDLGAVPRVLSERGWPRAVLKPSFTANAYGAVRFDAADAGSAVEHARRHPVDSEWMLQPYLDAVEREGEWSLVFFGGVFSHAARKRPGAGDFRVQAEHGGRSERATPPPHVLASATRVVQAAVPETLYARVDGVDDGRTLRLMELEVVEPELFFRLCDEAPGRFADALLARVSVARS